VGDIEVEAPIEGTGSSSDPLGITDLGIATGKIADNAVTYGKIQQVTSGRLLGRYSAGSGTAQEITLGSGLSLSIGGELSASGGGGGITALTGDVTASGSGSVAATSANNAVTTVKIQDNAVTAAKIGAGEVGASELASTAVTAGSYEVANVTLDQDGRTTSASSGLSTVSYAGSISFGKLVTNYGSTTLSATITPTKTTTGQQPGYGAIWRVVGNGTDSVNLVNFKIAGDGVFDKTNGILNLLMFMYDGTDHWVGIIQEGNGIPADVTSPTLASAVVTNTNKNIIALTYNETLDATSTPSTASFSASGGKTVTGVSISGLVVSVTVNSSYAFGDVITITYNPGASPIRDVAGNNAASLSSQSVTNQIINLTALTFTTKTAGFLGSSSPYTNNVATNWETTGLADQKIATGTNGYIMADITSVNSDIMLAFNNEDENDEYAGISGKDGYEFFCWYTGTAVYRGHNASNVTLVGTFASGTNSKLRLDRTGTTVTIQTTTDGTTWTTVYTFAPTSTGDVFINASFQDASSILTNPFGFNVIPK